MGMFDHVRCEYPLPEPELQDELFQSKDTPVQGMVNYLVTREGELLELNPPKSDVLFQEIVNGPVELVTCQRGDLVTVTLHFEDRRVRSATIQRETLGKRARVLPAT